MYIKSMLRREAAKRQRAQDAAQAEAVAAEARAATLAKAAELEQASASGNWSFQIYHSSCNAMNHENSIHSVSFRSCHSELAGQWCMGAGFLGKLHGSWQEALAHPGGNIRDCAHHSSSGPAGSSKKQ